MHYRIHNLDIVQFKYHDETESAHINNTHLHSADVRQQWVLNYDMAFPQEGPFELHLSVCLSHVGLCVSQKVQIPKV